MRGPERVWPRRFSVIALALSTALTARAQASIPKVDVAIEASKEVVATDGAGHRTVALKPASEAATGDVIVYRLHASNSGTGPAMSASIEDPIPAGTVLVVDSVDKGGASVLASLDGGKTWLPFPATVTRKNAQGVSETVPAPAESYTALRWVLSGPLQPGEAKDVSFKVRVR